ncbi:PEP-CTERM motif protein [Opitutaceae bacterium TAV1]|nr:PEP-CTERM motif protein [Opitutaceae bacterium TAV1]
MKNPLPARFIKTLAAMISLMTFSPAFAGLAFDIDFGTYAIGDSFNAATGSGNLSGSAPSGPTKIEGSGTWTATVEPNTASDGNWLRFSFPAGDTASGNLEFFSPQGAGSQTGTWFAQFDYTFISGGGYLAGVSFLDNAGNRMGGHWNNVMLYADDWVGGNSLSPGVTNTLRMEVDMGSNAADSYRVYFNGSLVSQFTALGNTGGAEFGGFSILLGGGMGSLTPGIPLEFALNNIRVGEVTAVPEPATFAMLAATVLLAFAACARRCRHHA